MMRVILRMGHYQFWYAISTPTTSQIQVTVMP